MSQFTLYRMQDGNELVCRIQTDLGTDTAYLLCAPVVRQSDWPRRIPLLHVAVTIEQEPHLILMSQMIALPSYLLGDAIGSAMAARDEIIRAVDLIVTGF